MLYNVIPIIIYAWIIVDCIQILIAKLKGYYLIISGAFFLSILHIISLVLPFLEVVVTYSGRDKSIYIICSSILLFISYSLIFPFKFSSKKNAVSPYSDVNASYVALLCEPITRVYLKYFMINLHQEENILFYDDVMKFKRKNDIDLDVFGKTIIEKYINIGSKYEINISDKQREKILKKYRENGINKHIFNESFEEIGSLIRQNCCGDFLLSNYSKLAKDLLDWYNVYDELQEDIKEAIKDKINQKNYIIPSVRSITSNTNSDNKLRSGNASPYNLSRTGTTKNSNDAISKFNSPQ